MPILLLCLVGLSARAAVDPALLGLVMPEAKLLAGIEVGQSLVSPFGRYVLAQMQIDDPEFQRFMTETGFDPRRDLREIVMASDSEGRTLVLGRGVFNASRISSAARSAGVSVKPVGGVEMLVHEHGVLALLDAATAAMGHEALVRGVIERRSGGPALSGPLATKAKQVSASNHAWFATVTSPGEFLAGKIGDPNLSGAMQGNLLQSVQEASGGIRFGASSVTIAGEAVTRSEKDAQALVDVMKFLAGLVQMNRSNDPRAGKIASLADAAQFSAQGNVMTLVVTLPEDLIEKLFIPVVKNAAQAAR